MKGQVVLYRVDGLLEQAEFLARQNSDNMFIKAQDKWFGNMRTKHCKSISDKHASTICCIKFIGDLTEQTVQVVSGDVQGKIFLFEYKETLLGYKVQPKCVMQSRLGATYSLAPFI